VGTDFKSDKDMRSVVLILLKQWFENLTTQSKNKT
jgi:hypothetical protein